VAEAARARRREACERSQINSNALECVIDLGDEIHRSGRGRGGAHLLAMRWCHSWKKVSSSSKIAITSLKPHPVSERSMISVYASSPESCGCGAGASTVGHVPCTCTHRVGVGGGGRVTSKRSASARFAR
jgi:hypothetical protein